MSEYKLHENDDRIRRTAVRMKRMKTLVFTSKRECVIEIEGAYASISPDMPAAVPVVGRDELIFSVWPRRGSNGSELMLPSLGRVRFGVEGACCDSGVTVDWGDLTEIAIEPLSVALPCFGPVRHLSSMTLSSDHRRNELELYFDNGLRLAVSPQGAQPYSIALGEGREGRLFSYDAGNERLIAIEANTDAGQRLILLNERFETALDLRGDRALIEEGTPTVYESLGTVMGHEKRTRYELTGGGFKAGAPEVGFFTREPHEPVSDAERALELASELRLGLPGWNAFLRGGPLEEASAEELKDFFGEYDCELMYPAEEPAGLATIGLVKSGQSCVRPRKLEFSFDHGVITDVNEL